ncbi:MAG: NAD(P)H-dependent oxidoreductase [Bifidobacteriaceae bacterium]|jgi:NAD(P)H-dependent FMN reductase|nr:NAD(P)H-dependent oxidoreductase [Bifidobacteriaceae bacterium]
MSTFALISGSLRADSINSTLLQLAAGALPADARTESVRIGDLPFYNEDHDRGTPPEPVARLRAQLGAADGLLVSTPEYNGSISGVLRNAIDWASRPRGASALDGKPVAILAASPSPNAAEWARLELERSLGVAGARLIGHVGVGGAAAAKLAVGDLDAAVGAEVRALVAKLVDAA